MNIIRSLFEKPNKPKKAKDLKLQESTTKLRALGLRFRVRREVAKWDTGGEGSFVFRV